ncbi:alpha-tocopherol transfer protein-like, partial [Caerostris extrusa]
YSNPRAIFRLGQFDVTKATAQDMVATVFLLGEMILDTEATQICGGIIIIDAEGLTLQHYRQFVTIQFVSLLINLIQDCLPERLRAIHFVHEPFAYHAIYRIMQPMLKKKMKERVITFHGNDLSHLHRYVPKDFLPEEFGGNLGPFNNKEMAEYFYNQEAFIKRINKYGIIEKKSHK